MTARTVVESLLGATLAISATLPETYDQVGYESTDIVYTPVGEIETYGSHGMTAAITEHTPVDTGVVAKVKGSKNYGNMALTIGDLPSDAGQVILKAASESANHYSVMITYPDGVKHYLDVLVSKFEFQDGAVNDVKKIGVDLAICRRPTEVAAV